MPLSNRLHRTNLPVLKLQMPEKKEEKHFVSSIYITPEPKKNISFYPSVKSFNSLQAFFTYSENKVNFSHKVLAVFDIDEVLLHKRKIHECKNRISSITTTVPGTDTSINKLSQHADVICLTARPETCNPNLERHGINLLNPYNKITLTNEQIEELKKFGYVYKDNTIYTDQLEKGTALQVFYSFAKTPSYNTIIFIDDSKKNCLSVVYNLHEHDSNLRIEACHLTEPGHNMPCTINMDGYCIKNQPYFYVDNVTNDRLIEIPVCNNGADEQLEESDEEFSLC